jgi:hypothetical protein
MRHLRVNKEWFYDVSWSWSDSKPGREMEGKPEKPQPLTLTLTHNPTHISLIKSVSLVEQGKCKINQLRTDLWLNLFNELHRRLLSRKKQAA